MRTLTRCLVLAAACVSTGEVCLRAARFEYPIARLRGVVRGAEEDRAMRDGAALEELDARELWKPRPGARLPWTEDERVNSAGCRGPELPRARGPPARGAR